MSAEDPNAAGTATGHGLFAGRFRLEEELGSGTIGRVFRAFDVVRQDGVALKILHDDVTAAAGGLRGMVPLLRSVSRLGHPALRHLHDFNEWHGQVYLSLELVRQPTLEMRLREGRRWTVGEAAAALRPVVEALEHARSCGPHRAIRPGHLFVLEADPRPSGAGIVSGFPPMNAARAGSSGDRLGACPTSLKLADHGLAALLTREQQVTDAALRGNAAYLAPEIVTGTADGDELADRFALGQMWLAMVRGEPLLPGTPLTVLDELPCSRETELLRRLLASRPKDRPASWPEVAAVLTPTKASNRMLLGKLPALRCNWRMAAGAVLLLALLLGLLNRSAGRGRPVSVVVTPEEMRAAWAAWDETRLHLLAHAAGEPELLPIVQKHFAPARDWILARDWWRSEPASGGQVRDRARLVLAELAAEAAGAERALGMLQTLRPLLESARELAGPDFAFTNLPVAAWDVARARALESFRDRRFLAAAEGLERNLAEVHTELETLWAGQHALSSNALAAWRGELSAQRLPLTEPNRDLSAELQSATAARATNGWTGAVTGLRRVADTAAAWRAELRAIPPPPPGQRGNSLGMRFARVGFLWVSVWETRVLDFAAFVAENGRDTRYYWRREAAAGGPTHPVTMITVPDAVAFCEWLTRRERAAGLLRDGEGYRLPGDAEWSAFAGLPPEPEPDPEQRGLNARDHWPWGAGARDAGSGNYHTPLQFLTLRDSVRVQFDPFQRTAPAGSFAANPMGLHDLGGNVWEFVSDPFQPRFAHAPHGGYAARGGGFFTASRDRMRSTQRRMVENNDEDIGFRVVLAEVKSEP